MAHTLSNDQIDQLKSLHTASIDARNGYQEALEDAEGRGLTTLFRDMIAVHNRHADELGAALTDAGEKPDEGGSFMSTVHRTIMSVRSLFDGLDESVLPGLIDGEERNVGKYEDAKKLGFPASLSGHLAKQRAELVDKIAAMKAWKVQAGV
ncbi:PA2169 family four-helix-bundle protein [Tardiphaga sp. vice352]|uniref:ferritin-like domain-containing protein n=1 Tax=unclassified Tardiphaga TaxID=2631404 RepID=UPI001163F379|nr:MULTISPECIES: PA2169 family four-helix-bundle protein [unclassified Tardiphaga]MBC7584208.1 PA2169 family four-helix-bundle protein [Tardiphaga sp.]QDM17318.1 PA2169 family four-helix-bundle protein [Tardiphaga sp. vice278]QDM22292.1 PA2169 family four-helix-bundle protein [Tardiphaga sp. vice154]QDM27554.1 PA2169 family four-helix-bundle protein [Tardiphaga sp. vice304]QDM32692.1 PA2169 family four-helix-bundle protein [Tardiphaga sp. vice352]